jgi:phospholipase C
MAFEQSTARMLRGVRLTLAFAALTQNFFGPLVQSADADDRRTKTPIKHVIVIVGENRTFDHIFATYKPKPGESVSNLLSKGIINEDGIKGPNYALAHQYSADITGSPVYELSPTTGKALYPVLPAPLNGGPTNVCTDNGMCNIGDARS